MTSEWQRFRMDAARWIVPEQVGDADSLTAGKILHLLWLHPALRAIGWFRLGGWLRRVGVRGVPLWIQHRLLLKYGLELDPSTYAGGGLYIAHPVGCVLVAEHIGQNVTIVGATTFGVRDDSRRWPRVGDGAYIGIGARLIGDIDIGAGSRIGANAVVLQDVPPGATAVGIPARILGS